MLAQLPHTAPPLLQRRTRLGIGAALAAITFLVVAPLAQARGAPDGFADLAAKVTPAVVNVATVSKRKTGDESLQSMLENIPKDSPFYEMFRRFEQQRQTPSRPMRALGSGFIIDSAGYIVTNNHVIDGADEITVTLQDGRKFTAKLVGRDPKTDVALLKIDGDGKLPAVEFADSDKARVGDWVIAVGNPFGLGGTVTAGIISARNRDIHSGPYDDYFQVDAPINKGNSGGPLFGMDGKVLGINTAIYSPTGGSVGIGFAIPAAIAKPVIEQLRAHGKIERGWLGVSVQPMNDDIASALGLDRAHGGLVAQVIANTPAARAGLKPGDVILSVAGKPVETSRDLPRIVAALKQGSSADVVVWRDKKEQTINVKIGTQPAETASANPEQQHAGKASYGLGLAPLNAEAREAFNIPRNVHGVLIARVLDGSPAAEQGLEAGDVILRIGSAAVSDPSAAANALDAAKAAKKPAVLLIARRGETLFVVLKAGQA